MRIHRQIKLFVALAVAGTLGLAPPVATAKKRDDRQAIAIFVYYLARMSVPAEAPSAAPIDPQRVDAQVLGIDGTDTDEAAPPAPPPIYTVCYTADNRRGEKLASLEGRQFKGNSLHLRVLSHVSEAPGACRILLVSRRDERDVDVNAFSRMGILTIGETARFARRGGAFFVDEVGRKVSFEMNLASAAEAGLRPNAKLLQLATVVYKK